MEHTLKKLPESKVEICVFLGKDDLRKYIEETEKLIAGQINLQGFRPGKVPKDLARKQIGEQDFKERALQYSIEKSFDNVIEKECIEILSQEEIKIEENTAEKLVYKIILSVFPRIVVANYKGLNIPHKQVEIDEMEIDKVLEDLRAMKKTKQEVKRPAKKGDRVEIDFKIMVDGKMIENGSSQNHPLILGEDKFAPGFEDKIVGMETGQKKNFYLQIPIDYYQKDIAGKEIAVEVDLKKIEETSELPNLNDEFAKSLGNFQSVEDLRVNIKNGLTAEKQEKEKERRRLAILTKISENNKIEFPPKMTEQRLDAMINDFDAELHQKGLELGLYLAKINKTQDDLRNDWKKKAEEQVKMGLITHAIAREEKFNATEDEINGELAGLIDFYTRQGAVEQIQKINPEAIKSRIREVVVNEKVFDFLEKNN